MPSLNGAPGLRRAPMATVTLRELQTHNLLLCFRVTIPIVLWSVAKVSQKAWQTRLTNHAKLFKQSTATLS